MVEELLFLNASFFPPTAMMSKEVKRMTNQIKKLEKDNVKLIEMIKKKDAKIYELRDEVRRLVQAEV